MKVVQVVTQMEPGGAQRVAALLAEAFSGQGFEQQLWFLYRKRDGFEHLPYVRVFLDRPPVGPFKYALGVLRLFRAALRERPDVLITHTHYANILGQLAGVVARVPRRIAVQHCPVEKNPAGARRLDLVLGSFGAYTTNVAVSDSVVSSLRSYPSLYRRRVTRVHNGILLEDGPSDPVETRASFGIPESAPFILMVGRLASVKNHEVAIRAMSELPEVHLGIVGDGELRGYLEGVIAAAGLQNRVRLLGEHTPRTIARLLKAADVFVFPSLHEAMPLALAEAMAAGVPIVASDIPATRELLQDQTGQYAGVLVAEPDPTQLSRAIRDLLGSGQLRYDLGRRAKERAREFSVERMAENYSRVMNA